MSLGLNVTSSRQKSIKTAIILEREIYPSQRLFEKLGAEPNGISEFLLHEEADIRRCEEENIHLLDERIQELAKQFNVEPRKLLSHVLEYKLMWD